MKYYKVLTCILCTFLVLINFTFIYANEEDDLDVFKSYVESTEYYNDYKDIIKENNVLKKINIDEGERYTTNYILESNDNEVVNLVFIGDSKTNIIAAFYVKTSDSVIQLYDILKQYSTNIHLRGPVYECTKYTCNSWSYVDFTYDGACSAIIGSECTVFALIGQPIAAVACKFGVIAACSLSFGKKCNSYYEEIDVCEL